MARKSSAQNILVWVLMGLLILGLAGFGVDGFLSQRVTSIGKVGTRDIPAEDYSRALQQELRAIEQQFGQPFPLSQAQALGLDAQVRARLVTTAALESEADRIGISVGDAQVQRTLLSIPAFRGPGGAFDRETYRFALQSAGLTPARFEEDLRREAARGILQAATAAGVETPAAMRDALLDFYGTRHSFAVFTLTEALLETPLAAPDDAAVAAYHAANPDLFTAPEIRSLSYAWLTPEMLLDSVPVSEDALRQLYQTRLSDYVLPERRLVERLAFADTGAAQAAMERIASGATFEQIVAERGLSLDDTDMGDVTQAQLGAAGAAVFALAEPGQVSGPHSSPVGPAIFRMNAILNAVETPFEEVRDELRDELAGDSARREVAALYDQFEDLIAGGASVSDLIAETAMTGGRIDWSTDVTEGIAAYSEFRAAARSVQAGDFPQLRSLSDGGVFVVQLDAITPPALHPLEAVYDQAAEGARIAALSDALTQLAADLAAGLGPDAVDALVEATGLTPETYELVTRTDRLTGLPADLLDTLFEGGPGTVGIAAQVGQVLLAVSTDAQAPDPGDAQTLRLIEAIDGQIGAGLAQDVFGYFARALEREAGISFNQAAIDAVHAAFR